MQCGKIPKDSEVIFMLITLRIFLNPTANLLFKNRKKNVVLCVYICVRACLCVWESHYQYPTEVISWSCLVSVQWIHRRCVCLCVCLFVCVCPSIPACVKLDKSLMRRVSRLRVRVIASGCHLVNHVRVTGSTDLTHWPWSHLHPS